MDLLELKHLLEILIIFFTIFLLKLSRSDERTVPNTARFEQ